MAFRDTTSKTKAKKEPVKCEIIEKCFTFSDKGKVTKELRYLKWGDNNPSYDLRKWKVDKDGNEISMGGFTLDTDEIQALYEGLKKIAEAE